MHSVVPKGPMEGLADLAKAIGQGGLHPGHYLELLEQRYRATEPVVQTMVPQEEEPFSRLTHEMGELEKKFSKGFKKPPLYGIPVAIKDVIHVDGFPTRAGSRLPPEVLTGPEGPVVQRLRGLGALILGKTHTAEFAYLAPPPTRNPHDPERTPGGSSSGSAAAVACGICPLALGTQTAGSTLRPAAFCGVVGFKPSFGRIPTEGIIPLSPSLDHVGLFTRDLEGMILAASLLYTDWREPRPPEEPLLGIPEGPYLRRGGQESLDHLQKVISRLVEAGFRIRPLRIMENFEEIAHRHNRLMAGEAARVHEPWFSEFRALYRPETRALIERGMTVSPAEVETYRESRLRLRETLVDIMEREGLSLWLAPATVGPAPVGLHSTGESIMNLPWTHAGLPALAIPSGTAAQGLPMAVQLVGRWMGDEELLALARRVLLVLALPLR